MYVHKIRFCCVISAQIELKHYVLCMTLDDLAIMFSGLMPGIP